MASAMTGNASWDCYGVVLYLCCTQCISKTCLLRNLVRRTCSVGVKELHGSLVSSSKQDINTIPISWLINGSLEIKTTYITPRFDVCFTEGFTVLKDACNGGRSRYVMLADYGV